MFHLKKITILFFLLPTNRSETSAYVLFFFVSYFFFFTHSSVRRKVIVRETWIARLSPWYRPNTSAFAQSFPIMNKALGICTAPNFVRITSFII